MSQKVGHGLANAGRTVHDPDTAAFHGCHFGGGSALPPGDNGAGMDDISVSGVTTIADLIDDKITSAVMDVSWLGIPRAPIGELQGGDARENAATIDGILSGKITSAKRDLTIVNAAGAFVVAGLAKDFKGGIDLAREELDSGRALEKLRALQNFRAKTSV